MGLAHANTRDGTSERCTGTRNPSQTRAILFGIASRTAYLPVIETTSIISRVMSNGNPSQTPTNLRLLVILEAVSRAGQPVTPTEVNADLGWPKPTIHRLFATLEEEGFLERAPGGRTYAPARRLRSMAGGILSSADARLARQAILAEISRKIGETCNIALPDGDQMRYLERVETEWPLRIQLPVGSLVPLHATASGKMYLSTLRKAQLDRYVNAAPLKAHTINTLIMPEDLLSEVAKIRRNGYALDREEFIPNMIALAVPVVAANGRLMATVSFHAPSQRISPEAALSHLDALTEGARALSELVAD